VKTAQTLLFFLLFYVYLWSGVDLRLIYHGGGIIVNFPVFYRGWEFFREFLSYPGGPVEYASAFLAQFFRIGWAGAMIVTVQALLVWLCAGRIIRAIFGREIRWASFIAPIAVLIPYARYSYQFGTTLALLTALGFVCLYLGIKSKDNLTRLAVFVILSAILYWVAGWVYPIFTAMCVIYELLVKKRRAMSVAYLLLALVVLYVERLVVFGRGVVDVTGNFGHYSYQTGTMAASSIYVLYIFLPVCLIALLLLDIFSAGRPWLSGQWEKLRARFGFVKAGEGTGTVFNFTAAVLPFAMAVAAVYFLHDGKTRALIEIDYYACQKRWPEVLRLAQNNPHHIWVNLWVNHAVNRALYHRGELADDMFAYPQRPEALFLTAEKGATTCWKLADTYCDLGQMNMASYWLTSAIEYYGEQPMLMKRLALVNMVRGNIGTARVYLGALGKQLFDAGWARAYLEKIEQDPNLSADKEIQDLRSTMAEKDVVHKSIDETLFTCASRNQMAFEYLMAFYLLQGQFEKFLGNLNRLNDFNYARIPRSYEEAILYYNYTRHRQIEIPGRQISAESHKRFDGFVKVFIDKYKMDSEAAFDELARDYGDSYLFYCVYQQSGMKK